VLTLEWVKYQSFVPTSLVRSRSLRGGVTIRLLLQRPRWHACWCWCDHARGTEGGSRTPRANAGRESSPSSSLPPGEVGGGGGGDDDGDDSGRARGEEVTVASVTRANPYRCLQLGQRGVGRCRVVYQLGSVVRPASSGLFHAGRGVALLRRLSFRRMRDEARSLTHVRESAAALLRRHSRRRRGQRGTGGPSADESYFLGRGERERRRAREREEEKGAEGKVKERKKIQATAAFSSSTTPGGHRPKEDVGRAEMWTGAGPNASRASSHRRPRVIMTSVL